MNVPPMKSVVLHQTFPSSRIKTPIKPYLLRAIFHEPPHKQRRWTIYISQ